LDCRVAEPLLPALLDVRQQLPLLLFDVLDQPLLVRMREGGTVPCQLAILVHIDVEAADSICDRSSWELYMFQA
jgi:hypothetical protein